MNSEKPATGSRIPDLYELLSLPAKENSELAIKTAIRDFAERIKQMKSPEAAKQAAKLFSIAKQNLLDKSRKAAYDSLWDKVYGAKFSAARTKVTPAVEPQAVSVAATAESNSAVHSKPTVDEEPAWDLSELHNMLPRGDAHAPLDLAAFLESPEAQIFQRSTEDLDRDFQRLLQLLGGEVSESGQGPAAAIDSPTIVNSKAVAASFDFAVPATAVGELITNNNDLFPVANLVESSSGASNVLPPVVVPPATSVVSNRKKRKNRDRPLLVMIGGGLTVLLGILGALVFLLNNKLPTQDSPERILVAEKPNAPQVSGNRAVVNKGSGLPPPGSGLPRPGEAASNDIPANDGSMVEAPFDLPDTTNMEPTEPKNNAMLDAAPPTSTPPTSTPPTSTPPTSTPAPDAPTSAMVPESQTPMVKPDSEPSEPEQPISLGIKEKVEWKKIMRAARQSIGKTDYEIARASLENAAGLAKTPAQKSQLSRLSTILPLVQELEEAMKSAALRMKASETFQAGTQEISMIEATEEKLAVRISGGTKRYKWDEVPIILAYGLADLKMNQSPRTAAAKAAFAAVQSKLNGNAKEEARKLMQSAAAAKVVPADTHEVFDDDYSLD